MTSIQDPKRFKQAIKAFDAANAEDPNQESWQGKEFPKELLYAKRMTECLFELADNPSEALQLAVRAQHLRRWEISRSDFSADRIGYLQWRTKLKTFHAEKAAAILREAGYEEAIIDRVDFLLKKKQLKKDRETQMLEDAACLVFLKYYFEPFSPKQEEGKMIDILRKTWKKMSPAAQKQALNLTLPEKNLRLIQKAIQE